MEGIPSKLQREWQRIGPIIFPKMKWRYEGNYYEGEDYLFGRKCGWHKFQRGKCKAFVKLKIGK